MEPDAALRPPTSEGRQVPSAPEQPAEEPVRLPPPPALEDEALLRSISRVSTMTIPAALLSEKPGAEIPPSPGPETQAAGLSTWEDVDDDPVEREMYDPPGSPPPPGPSLRPLSDTPAPVHTKTAVKEESLADNNLWSRLQSLKPISRTVTVTEVRHAS